MKKTTQFTTTTRKGFYFILLLSTIAISGLLFIIYGKESGQSNAIASEFLSYFVLLNIVLNSASSLCILCGFRAIRLRRIAVHKKFMLLAFTFSALFLISYIYYHYNHGSTAFLGQGIVRPIYFFILISHLILAAITLPAVLVTFYFAFISQFKLHTAISSYTLYAWLYVSLSGIVIYGFLKYFNGI